MEWYRQMKARFIVVMNHVRQRTQWLGTRHIENVILIATLVASLLLNLRQTDIANQQAAIAKQQAETDKFSQQINIKPIVFRSGVVFWSQINDGLNADGSPFFFTSQNNIAKNISGYIIDDSKQYTLYFAPAQEDPNTGAVHCLTNNVQEYVLIMNWVKKDSYLCARRLSTDVGTSTDKPDEFYISYQDIISNPYIFEEPINVKQ